MSLRPVDEIVAEILDGLDGCTRVVIVGGPKVGKTTVGRKLAVAMGAKLVETDVFAEMEWSEVSNQVAVLLAQPGVWVIEGTAAVRGLRKWLVRNEGPPPFAVVRLARVTAERSDGQETMAKGILTIWREIAPELRARGVRVLADESREA